MDNVIAILIIAMCVGMASRYIYKQKKSGNKCIGCANSKTCSKCSCSK